MDIETQYRRSPVQLSVSMIYVKNIVNNELKGRDLKHVEYGIMKELENVWNMYSKRLFQLNNRTQKRYKQIKPIYLQNI
jgi:hypothetical protein